MSLSYDYEHNKDYAAFRAAVLKLFAAKRPFDTTQVKKDLKHFSAEAWNGDKKDVMMYCFFKRCLDDDEQFKHCLHFARRLFDVSPQGLSDKQEALVVECMPNVWWGCGKDDDLRALTKVEAAYAAEAAAGAAVAEGGVQNIVKICRSMLAANEGQNRFGEVAGPFLAFLKDFSDYNDFRYVCKKQMGLDKVYYVLDPASGALTSLDAVDATGRCAAEGGGARVWEPDGSCFRFSLGGVSCA